MADNVNITPGSGAEIAADDIAGVLFQRVKVAHGADGAAVDTSAANPLPVTISSTVTIDGSLTDTELRATAVAVTLGAEVVDVLGPLTDTELRAEDLNVSLDGETIEVLGPLTDTELRATPVPVSGPLTDDELRAADLVVSLDGEEIVVIEKVVPLTVVVGSVASLGDNTLIAAPGADTILSLAELTIQLEGSGATVVQVKSGSTVIRRWYLVNAGSGVTWVFDQGREMRLAENEALVLHLSAANTVGYTVRYFEEAV